MIWWKVSASEKAADGCAGYFTSIYGNDTMETFDVICFVPFNGFGFAALNF